MALYDDLKTLEKLWAREMSDEENSRETVALTVTFDDETGVPVADLDASRRLGWEVAGPEAYPSIFRKERGLSMRPPLAWELELMEGCLRAIPAFVARHRPDDMSKHKSVTTGSTSSGASYFAVEALIFALHMESPEGAPLSVKVGCSQIQHRLRT